jgi:hypothetical protein
MAGTAMNHRVSHSSWVPHSKFRILAKFRTCPELVEGVGIFTEA